MDAPSNVTDGGSGLFKALRKVNPNAINIRDFFNVVAKIKNGLNALERHCYNAKIMLTTRKSNSLVETINSVIRRHLVAYKSVPKWFCPLFTYYWNNRRFTRGKRKGLKPKEILTGKHFECDWIDLIIEKWPQEELKQIYKTQELQLAG